MMKILFNVKKADSILTCARMCRREAACKEASFFYLSCRSLLGTYLLSYGLFRFHQRYLQKKIRACSFAYKKTFFLMMKMLFKVKKADSILTFAQICRREAACKEASFLANKGTRSLFDEGQKARKLKRFIKWDGSFYIEKVLLEFCRFFRLM